MTGSMTVAAGRSAWRFFPHGIIGALAFVILVNFGMIWSALNTFPGAVNDHAFDTGNSYNEILALAQREAALGWRLELRREGTLLLIALTDQRGQPVADATISAVARRPVGPDEATSLSFAPDGSRYVARQFLAGPGQWDVEIVAAQGSDVFHLSRRLTLR